MTYQDEIINQLMADYETAVVNYENQPSLSHGASLSKARHSLIKFLKDAKNANQ